MLGIIRPDEMVAFAAFSQAFIFSSIITSQYLDGFEDVSTNTKTNRIRIPHPIVGKGDQLILLFHKVKPSSHLKSRFYGVEVFISVHFNTLIIHETDYYYYYGSFDTERKFQEGKPKIEPCDPLYIPCQSAFSEK